MRLFAQTHVLPAISTLFNIWLQAIEKFWADVLDDTIVAKNYKQAMQHAENSNYGAVWLALGNVCTALDKQT